MKKKFADLIDVKSIITLLMTITLIVMLVGEFNPTEDFKTMFNTAYVAIITYFFTKKNSSDKGDEQQ